VACRFYDEDVPAKPGYRLDAVHGEQDEAVDFQPSLDSHRAIVARGVKGEYLSDAASGHRMTPALVALVKRALAHG
jgi:hypothetical protein